MDIFDGFYVQTEVHQVEGFVAESLRVFYPLRHVFHLVHEIFVKVAVPVTLNRSALSCSLLHVSHSFFNLWADFRIIA